MRTLTITMPLPTNLANARLHWAAKLSAHNAWKLRAIADEPHLRGKRPRRPLERVEVAAVFYVGSVLMDDDNATARLKWPLDLLKERGVIVDDKRPHLRLAGIPEQRQGTPRRVVLTITGE